MPADPFALAADIFDPPAWQPIDRAPLLPHQEAPPGDWNLFLLEGGRGSGKTEASARYFANYMRAHPGHRGRIIAPTLGDAVESCIEGHSGLLAIDPEIQWRASAPGGSKVVWPNGSEALVLGTPTPRDVDRLRAGGNRNIDWWEEMAANPQLEAAWDQAQFGLRLGAHPHSIASTTPRGSSAYRAIRQLAGTVLRHATLFDNPHNSPEWVATMRERYEGTRIGRQELAGELLEDIEGALWVRQQIDRDRVDEAPELVKIVVAIDPAVSSGERSDDTGIVVVGRGVDKHGYVLADRSQHTSPDAWARTAVRTYDEFEASQIVAEVNNGGDLVGTVIKTIEHDGPVSFKKVHASRGKQTRAEPIAALYEQGRMHHVGLLAKLEDELCLWVPGEGASPDRVDALVWGATETMLGGGDASISRTVGRVPETVSSSVSGWQAARTRQIRGR